MLSDKPGGNATLAGAPLLFLFASLSSFFPSIVLSKLFIALGLYSVYGSGGGGEMQQSKLECGGGGGVAGGTVGLILEAADLSKMARPKRDTGTS